MNVPILLGVLWSLAAHPQPSPQDLAHSLGVNRAWLFGRARLHGLNDDSTSLYTGYWSSMEDNPKILFPAFRSDLVFFLGTNRDDIPPNQRHYLTCFRNAKGKAVRLWQVVLSKSVAHQTRPRGTIARLLYEEGLAVPATSARKALQAVAKVQELARYQMAVPIDSVWCWFISQDGRASKTYVEDLGQTSENLKWRGFLVTPPERAGLLKRSKKH